MCIRKANKADRRTLPEDVSFHPRLHSFVRSRAARVTGGAHWPNPLLLPILWLSQIPIRQQKGHEQSSQLPTIHQLSG